MLTGKRDALRKGFANRDHACRQLGQALGSEAGSRAGNADRSGKHPAKIEDRHGNAANAEIEFFIVQGKALETHLFQIRYAEARGRSGYWE